MGKKIAALSDEAFATWLAEKDRKDQEALAQDYYYGTRKVARDGRVSCWGKRYQIGRQFAGRRVCFKEYKDRLVFEIQDVRKAFPHVREPLPPLSRKIMPTDIVCPATSRPQTRPSMRAATNV